MGTRDEAERRRNVAEKATVEGDRAKPRRCEIRTRGHIPIWNIQDRKWITKRSNGSAIEKDHFARESTLKVTRKDFTKWIVVDRDRLRADPPRCLVESSY